MSMNDLVEKQRQLMEYVPHDASPGAVVKMTASIKLLDVLLRYLNSTGHKPWRPVPLSPIVQQGLMKELKEKVGVLSYIHSTGAGADKDFSNQKHFVRQMISAFGVIEETVEYINTLTAEKPDPAHQLEELVDALFFWMEQLILGGYTWDQIEQEYGRKWEENMERYRRAKEGDYSWDKRSKENL